MAPRAARLLAAGLALGAALALSPAAPAVPARAATEDARAGGQILRPNSNLRWGPSTAHGVVANTGAEWGTGLEECFVYGERVTAGGYTTDVWYRLNVYFGGVQYYKKWAWGGNVEVGADPKPGLRTC
ncbi:hypothetical protein [Streptomyces sp. NPDC015131]|uniref:hypothetical protein n=1 Tax=Streptomyces sp. NPDC015131 TaxID=3364941 RepID=UPI0036FBCEF5